MSHPVINGLATYGIIRLFNTGRPVLAFLITLLFVIGPVGILFWLFVGWAFIKPVLIVCGFIFVPFITGALVGGATSSNENGWMVAITLYTFELMFILFVLTAK